MHLKKTNEGKNASIFTYSFLTTVDFNWFDNALPYIKYLKKIRYSVESRPMRPTKESKLTVFIFVRSK